MSTTQDKVYLSTNPPALRLYYTDHFDLPLPDGHRFPMAKYRLLRQRVAESEHHRDDVLVVPQAATDEELLTCHTPDYVQRVQTGTLTKQEIRRIGFPWSLQMAERSRRSTGATISAARAALAEGISANLAGGTHHAFAGEGEGYCVFNDAAVAIRTLQAEGLIQRAAIIDLDVHQGNGTASILKEDPSVFTCSVHGVKNFPLRKVPSDLDVSLPDGTADEDYCQALQIVLNTLQKHQNQSGRFELVVYLAGADPFQNDRLGRLSLTMDGLRQRDEMVLQWCHQNELPVAIAMAGGYASSVSEIVDIHSQTLHVAKVWSLSR
ncbi:histone deacetylase/AcuC/AphA family protein [Rhodopirellula islandica]|uniref:Histone deacetylase/AcuC/AphA family protein n=1 Tax=Rhodopirellula islandica TaxID=595434 RepID=A0A0J1BJ55_RHOIS|nr:histone deacetylase [Rhodopirellula islandica]KLU06557.1 histone deacetylase/AcuC/AphA family protein [Rhodopirellula islandica]